MLGPVLFEVRLRKFTGSEIPHRVHLNARASLLGARKGPRPEIAKSPCHGSRSRSQAAPEGERDTVTAPYANLKESEDLTESLDPHGPAALAEICRGPRSASTQMTTDANAPAMS